VLICPGFVPVEIPTEKRTPDRVCSTINLDELRAADSRGKETNDTFMRKIKEGKNQTQNFRIYFEMLAGFSGVSGSSNGDLFKNS
jgi:hypothetical protein